MIRKRTPVAEVGAEDYRIVKHTHNIGLASALMRAKLHEEEGCPGQDAWPPNYCSPEKVCLHKWLRPGRAVQVWVRIQGALPNSYAASEGWSFAYHECDGPGRGVFPAVLFR